MADWDGAHLKDGPQRERFRKSMAAIVKVARSRDTAESQAKRKHVLAYIGQNRKMGANFGPRWRISSATIEIVRS